VGTIALIVETVSPGDTMTATTRRVIRFLRTGVPTVWLVDPEVRGITVFEQGKSLRVFDERDEASGTVTLPDFRCRIAEWFAPSDEDAAGPEAQVP
jgi:Uma2 family endonuclease